MRLITLSKRLRTVAGMVTKGSRVCDVGCDHGFVPVYLVQQGISPRVLAMDLREGPLRAAREHVAAFGMEGKISTRLSDGLHNYKPNEADTLICAGMGGGLMQRILGAEREKTDSFRELILQPQSEIEQFRRFLRVNAYEILAEEILEEDGKFYQVIKAAGHGATEGQADTEAEDAVSIPQASDDRAKDELCKLEDRYGPILLRKRTPVFLSFLEREAAVYEEILVNLRKRGLTEEKRSARYAEVELLLRENRYAGTLFK